LSLLTANLGCGGAAQSAAAPPVAPGPDREHVRAAKCPDILSYQIHFQFEKSDVLPTSFPIVDAVADAMAKSPGIKVSVVGNADNREQNDASISRARADAVMQLLIARNVASNRMTAVGGGATSPIVPNDSDQNRALNRYVKFVATNCGGAP
jgi:outer membrane protein OmpA-like peptidoglycan-associated protein